MIHIELAAVSCPESSEIIDFEMSLGWIDATADTKSLAAPFSFRPFSRRGEQDHGAGNNQCEENARVKTWRGSLYLATRQ